MIVCILVEISYFPILYILLWNYFLSPVATHGYGPSLKRKKNLETLIDWEEKMKIMYAACFRVTRL